MPRADYVYVILAGARRDHIMGTFTVKREMRRALAGLASGRDDLTVKRHRDGELSTGTIMDIPAILEGR